ncbi:hypothetical protein QBC47DRAFT_84623 [Echria macrotheca]|uniref:Ankyrin repeat protein n=1 Tax=Echria macrotheca TaxID=438768 RepID=A0AAJ0B3Y4_9PEZI|nr:hypothetical protein QBC47DRAFT_84623 [Echria macrotheca]
MDPLSTAASIIAIADTTLTVGREILNIISQYRHAHESLAELCDELHVLNRIVNNVKFLCASRPRQLASISSNAVQDVEACLKQFVCHLNRLALIVQELLRGGRSSKFDRISLTAKLYKKKKHIKDIRLRLKSEQGNIALYISLLTLAGVDLITPSGPSPLPEPTGPVTLIDGISTHDAALFAQGYFPYIMLTLCGVPPASRDGYLWLGTQLNELAKDADSMSTRYSASHQPRGLIAQPQPACSPSSNVVSTSETFTSSVALSNEPGVIQNTTLSTSKLSSGELMILIQDREQKTDDGRKSKEITRRGRLAFLPSADQVSPGVIADFAEGPALRVSRSLRSFRVHPSTSPVFECLISRNVAKVDEMIRAGLVLPNDRDAAGNSLLHYAASAAYSVDMCTLLLDRGADPRNCNLYGDDLVSLMVSKLPRDADSIPEKDRALIRRLLSECRSEVSSTRQYRKKGAAHLAPASVLHCLFSRDNAHVRVSKLLGDIIRDGFDIESTDLHGNTPLLLAVYYCPPPELFQVVDILIEHGAKVRATNNFGEDALHFMVRRLSNCNNFAMGPSMADEYVKLLCRLMEKGCDPTRGNMYGFTAVDAAMSPTAWPLFCRALKDSDMDPEWVIRRACDAKVPPPTDEEMDEMYTRAQSKRASLVGYQLQTRPPGSDAYLTNKPCCLCGAYLDMGERSEPFDEFHSVVEDEFGFGIHMTWYMHCKGGHECLHIYMEDSCHSLDYRVDLMPEVELKRRSLRRRVALLLWERGQLSTPAEAQEWVTGTPEVVFTT